MRVRNLYRAGAAKYIIKWMKREYDIDMQIGDAFQLTKGKEFRLTEYLKVSVINEEYISIYEARNGEYVQLIDFLDWQEIRL